MTLACVSRAPAPDCMSVNVDLDAGHAPVAHMAAKDWQEALGLATGGACGWRLTMRDAKPGEAATIDRDFPSVSAVLGVTKRNVGTIVVMTERIDGYAERAHVDPLAITYIVAAHELGHALGLEHGPDDGSSIMAETVDKSPACYCLPLADVRNAAALSSR